MNLYQKMYTTLFNRVTDALKEIEVLNFGNAAENLKEAQKKTEEMYAEADGKKENAKEEEKSM